MGCAQNREGRYSKQLLYQSTEIMVVQGVLEELDSQVIINLSYNPYTSFIRTQAYKYVIGESMCESPIRMRQNAIHLETLPNNVFVKTEQLLHYKVKMDISLEDYAAIIEEILMFVVKQQNIWQIAFYITSQFELTSSEIIEQLVPTVLKFLRQKHERPLISVKFLCSRSHQFVNIVKTMIANE